eukprot:scaffold427819_cov31-Prasinocladus_malaysianus.AAC.1
MASMPNDYQAMASMPNDYQRYAKRLPSKHMPSEYAKRFDRALSDACRLRGLPGSCIHARQWGVYCNKPWPFH